MWEFIKKQIDSDSQVFWVCPLIKDSSLLDYSSVKKKFEIIYKKFPNKVGLIHGALDKNEKVKVLDKFLKKAKAYQLSKKAKKIKSKLLSK